MGKKDSVAASWCRQIDRIYEGMLRYGRPAPDFSGSSDHTVSVLLPNAEPDMNFMRMLIAHEDKKPLPLDSLIILSALREERRRGMTDLVKAVQKTESSVHSTVEKLVEAGLVEPQGAGRTRLYTLSAAVYAQAGKKSEYVRQAGFSIIQNEQMVLSFIDAHKCIKRSDVMELCHLSGPQAYHLLQRMIDKNLIRMEGLKKYAIYKR